MGQDIDFDVNEAKGANAVNYVRALLKSSGYDVIDFGIETHKLMDSALNKNYKTDTNCMLHSMPDLVVVDKVTNEAEFVEVKYRETYNDGKFRFKYSRMKNYLDYWQSAILVLVIKDTPSHCHAVRIKDINWHRHFAGPDTSSKGRVPNDVWILRKPILKEIKEIFPKVTDNNLLRVSKLLP